MSNINVTVNSPVTKTAVVGNSAGLNYFIASTGSLTGAFYPLKTNPSGYAFSSQTGNFATQADITLLRTGAHSGHFKISGDESIGVNYHILNAPTNGLIVEGNIGMGIGVPRGGIDFGFGTSLLDIPSPQAPITPFGTLFSSPMQGLNFRIYTYRTVRGIKKFSSGYANINILVEDLPPTSWGLDTTIATDQNLSGGVRILVMSDPYNGRYNGIFNH